jgi:phospholipid/cholesterol/gamma-HCH transport system ATP-binding protein
VNVPQIELKDLHKSFGEQRVLDGIDLTVEESETISVLGRSGTGKSVLLKLLIGLEKPDSGSICIDGHEITELETKGLNEVRKNIGFLFQQAALYDSMTIEQNVEFPLKRHTSLNEEERKKRVKELLESVGLKSDYSKLPAELSGGMKKRVGLARALALDPKLIMFDEPTAGLDPISSTEIDQLILDLKKKHKMTSVVVTHDLHSAKHISDRLVVLDSGRIVAEGTFDDLEKSKHPVVKGFLREQG